MSSAVRNHLQRALTRWPKDPLRPNCQLQDVLAKRLEPGATIAPKASVKGMTQEQADLQQANAILSLLENRYSNKYPLTGKLLNPQSNPSYYKDLIKELEEAPNRSVFDRLKKRIGGMVRLS